MKSGFFFLFFFLIRALFAQDCTLERYQKLLKEADQAAQKGYYDLSINKLQSAKTCRPEKEGEISQKIVEVFREVNRQRQMAKENEKRAMLNLEKANRLIHHLDFRREPAAWAYKNNKFAVINLNGDTLTDFKYDAPQPFIGGTALVNVNNQYVFIDAKGNELSERYDFVLPVKNNCYMAGRGEKRKLLNNKGETLFLLEHENYWNWSENGGYLKLLNVDNPENTGGLVNSACRIVVPSEYTRTDVLPNRLFSVDRHGEKGILNKTGQVKIPCMYEDITWLNNRFLAVKMAGKWGIADTNGTERIKPQWNAVRMWPDEGLIGVLKNDKWGILDTTGKPVTGLIYDDIGYDFYGGLLTFRRGEQPGALNRHGIEIDEQVVRLETGIRELKSRGGKAPLDTVGLMSLLSPYETYKIFGENLFGVYNDGFWHAINRKGEEAFLTELKEVSDIFWMGNGLLGIQKAGKTGLIKTNGIEVLPPVFNELNLLGPDSLGLFCVSEDRKKGIIQLDGTALIPQIYDDIFYDDKCDLIRIEGGLMQFGTGKGQKEGMLNTRCETIVPVEYEDCRCTGPGSVWIAKDNVWTHLNTAGVEPTPPRYLDKAPFTKDLIWVQKVEGWILIDRNGAVVTKNNYMEPVELKNGFAAVVRDGKRGILNRKGIEVVKPLYFNISEFKDGHAWVTAPTETGNTKIGIIDTAGKEIVHPQYDLFIGPLYLSEDIMFILKNGKRGLLHLDGRELIEPKYEEMSSIEGSKRTIRVKKDGKWGIADTTGAELIPPQFDGISGFHDDGAIWVERNRKEGLIDSMGKEIIKIEYDHADVVSNGWILTLKDREEGYFEFIRPGGATMKNGARYEDAKSFMNGFAAVKKDGTWRLIDTFGTEIKTLDYGEIGDLWDGVACVEKDGKWGVVNSNWIKIIEPVYDEIDDEEFSGGVAWVRKDDKWGLIDNKGAVIFEPQFDDYYEYDSDSLVSVTIDGKYGLAKKDGAMIVPAEYDNLPDFDEAEFKFGVESIVKSGKSGIINREGKIIITAQYDDGRYPVNGLIMVKQDGKWGIIDTAERVILPFEYSGIYPSGFSQFTLEQNGRFGFFAPDHHVLLPCIYEKIGYPGEERGWIRVQQNGKWGWVDNTGRVMIPIRYDAVSPFAGGKAEVSMRPLPHIFKINYAGQLALWE